MPTTASPADQLLQRARTLRRLALSIDQTDVTLLSRRAGIGTWIGPTPQRCLDDLVGARALLAHATDLLRSSATRLDQRAAQLDRATRLAGTSVGVV